MELSGRHQISINANCCRRDLVAEDRCSSARDGEGGCRQEQQDTHLDGWPRIMAFFKRKNMLSRKACSSCFVSLAIASLLLLYFGNKHSPTQSQLDPPDIDLNSDTNIQRLPYFAGIDQDDNINVIAPLHPGRDVSNSSSRPVMNRFIIGINYWEQLTMAMINMHRLVCLGERWNASVVQPFTLDSRLYGLRNFKAGKNCSTVHTY